MRGSNDRFFAGKHYRISTERFRSWACWAERNPNPLWDWFDDRERITNEVTEEILRTGVMAMGVGAEMPAEEILFKDPFDMRIPTDRAAVKSYVNRLHKPPKREATVIAAVKAEARFRSKIAKKALRILDAIPADPAEPVKS